MAKFPERKGQEDGFNLAFALFVVFFTSISAFLAARVLVDAVIANPNFFRFYVPTFLSILTIFIMLLKWMGSFKGSKEGKNKPSRGPLDYEDSVMIDYLGLTETMVEDSLDERIKRSGNRGEQEVAYTLSWLPESFQVFHRVYLEVRGRGQQIDHLVVGPTGIFHLETKNLGGEISLSPSGDWSITKRISGRMVTEGMENPLEQVRRHEVVLGEWLEERWPGEALPHYPLIVLSHPKAVLKGEGHSPVPIVKKEKLLDLLQGGEAVLTPERVKAVVDALKACFTDKQRKTT